MLTGEVRLAQVIRATDIWVEEGLSRLIRAEAFPLPSEQIMV
jgi:hypothetical protein